MNNNVFRIGFLLGILLTIPLIAGCGENRTFYMDQVDIQAQVLNNGDLYVQELYTYRFEGSFNGTTRSIPEKGHQGMQFFEAYLPPPGSQLGTFSYRDAERLEVEKKEDTYYPKFRKYRSLKT